MPHQIIDTTGHDWFPPSRVVIAPTPKGFRVLPTPEEVGKAIAKDCLEILRKAMTPSERSKADKSTIRQ